MGITAEKTDTEEALLGLLRRRYAPPPTALRRVAEWLSSPRKQPLSVVMRSQLVASPTGRVRRDLVFHASSDDWKVVTRQEPATKADEDAHRAAVRLGNTVALPPPANQTPALTERGWQLLDHDRSNLSDDDFELLCWFFAGHKRPPVATAKESFELRRRETGESIESVVIRVNWKTGAFKKLLRRKRVKKDKEEHAATVSESTCKDIAQQARAMGIDVDADVAPPAAEEATSAPAPAPAPVMVAVQVLPDVIDVSDARKSTPKATKQTARKSTPKATKQTARKSTPKATKQAAAKGKGKSKATEPLAATDKDVTVELTCSVNGVFYFPSCVRYMQRDRQLVLQREPHNAYDRNSIAVMVKRPHVQAGHVPKEVAANYAPLIDEKIITMEKAKLVHGGSSSTWDKPRMSMTVVLHPHPCATLLKHARCVSVVLANAIKAAPVSSLPSSWVVFGFKRGTVSLDKVRSAVGEEEFARLQRVEAQKRAALRRKLQAEREIKAKRINMAEIIQQHHEREQSGDLVQMGFLREATYHSDRINSATWEDVLEVNERLYLHTTGSTQSLRTSMGEVCGVLRDKGPFLAGLIRRGLIHVVPYVISLNVIKGRKYEPVRMTVLLHVFGTPELLQHNGKKVEELSDEELEALMRARGGDKISHLLDLLENHSEVTEMTEVKVPTGEFPSEVSLVPNDFTIQHLPTQLKAGREKELQTYSQRAHNDADNVRRFEGALDEKQLAGLVEELRKGSDDIAMAEQPARMISTLMPHQRQGLRWMLDKELAPPLPNPPKDPMYRRCNFFGRAAWYHQVTGEMTTVFPAAPPKPRGGVLADEMGLGKTVQTISVMVENYPWNYGTKEFMDTVVNNAAAQPRPEGLEDDVPMIEERPRGSRGRVTLRTAVCRRGQLVLPDGTAVDMPTTPASLAPSTPASMAPSTPAPASARSVTASVRSAAAAASMASSSSSSPLPTPAASSSSSSSSAAAPAPAPMATRHSTRSTRSTRSSTPSPSLTAPADEDVAGAEVASGAPSLRPRRHSVKIRNYFEMANGEDREESPEPQPMEVVREDAHVDMGGPSGVDAEYENLSEPDDDMDVVDVTAGKGKGKRKRKRGLADALTIAEAAREMDDLMDDLADAAARAQAPLTLEIEEDVCRKFAKAPMPQRDLVVIPVNAPRRCGVSPIGHGVRMVASPATLIVCPNSVAAQWKSELYKHAGRDKFSVLVWHGQGRTRSTREVASYDVVITTYATVSSEWNHTVNKDAPTKPGKARKDGKPPQKKKKKGWSTSPLYATHFWRIVLDEGHYVRNRKTAAARAVCELRGNLRWVLTGTPIVNKHDDFFSLVSYIGVRPLGLYPFWKRWITDACESKRYSKVGSQRFVAVVSPLVLQRKKTHKINGQKIIDLPEKKTETVELVLSEPEQDFYTALYKRAHTRFSNIVKQGTVMNQYANVLEMLLRLRQAADSALLVLPSLLRKERQLRELGAKADDEELAGVQENIDLYKKHLEEAALKAGQSENFVQTIMDQVEAVADGLVECPICFESMRDIHPCALPCMHMFCKDCLESLLRTRGPKAPCPTCRKDFTKGDVRVVPLDQIMKKADAEEGGAENEGADKDDDDDDKGKGKGKGKGKATGGEEAEGEDEADPAESTKIKALVIALREMKARGDGSRATVFSQWTTMLDLIENSLKRDNMTFSRIDGSMSMQQRSESMRKLQASEVDCILVSLKAGGEGINLTSANFVFMMDPWFNVAVENQAIDRVHRIGQRRVVTVKRFIIKDSIEQRMLKLQERKSAIASSVFGKSRKELRAMRLKDLKFLFSANPAALQDKTTPNRNDEKLSLGFGRGDNRAPPRTAGSSSSSAPRSAATTAAQQPATATSTAQRNATSTAPRPATATNTAQCTTTETTAQRTATASTAQRTTMTSTALRPATATSTAQRTTTVTTAQRTATASTAQRTTKTSIAQRTATTASTAQRPETTASTAQITPRKRARASSASNSPHTTKRVRASSVTTPTSNRVRASPVGTQAATSAQSAPTPAWARVPGAMQDYVFRGLTLVPSILVSHQGANLRVSRVDGSSVVNASGRRVDTTAISPLPLARDVRVGVAGSGTGTIMNVENDEVIVKLDNSSISIVSSEHVFPV